MLRLCTAACDKWAGHHSFLWAMAGKKKKKPKQPAKNKYPPDEPPFGHACALPGSTLEVTPVSVPTRILPKNAGVRCPPPPRASSFGSIRSARLRSATSAAVEASAPV